MKKNRLVKKGKEERFSDILGKRTTSERVIYVIVFILFLLYSACLILPVVWLFVNSLTDGAVFYDNCDPNNPQPFAFPETWEWENYIEAFTFLNIKGTSFFGMLFNSLWYTAVVTLEGCFLSACTGYVFAKYNFRAKPIMYTLVIFSLTVPTVGTLGASFKLAYDLGLYDTPLQPIVFCAGGFGFNFLILYSFFKSIPRSYSEAVFIDGGNHFTAFFKVNLPMAMPSIAALMVMAAITCWNDYSGIILFIPSYPTISAGLYYAGLNQQVQFDQPIYFAELLLSMIPVLVLFITCSDSVMKNISVGGLKG